MSNQDSMQDADTSVEVGQPSQPRKQIDPRMGAMLFSIGGVAAGLCGALSAFGPRLLPAQAQLFDRAAANGLTAGVLWGVAAVLFSLGVLARSLGRNVEALAETDDLGLLVDQIASDLAQTRTSMQELRVEFVYLKENVTSMGRDLPTQIASTNESTTRDAMYRLAASLDQVGARLEQRIRSQHGTLEGTLQEVQQSLKATCEQVEQIQQAMTQVSSAPAAGWDMPAEPVQPPISLGVLDHLADENADTGDTRGAYGAPLPSGPQTYEEKLVQLAQLLSDPRVRSAADGMTRSRGL